MTTNDPHLNQPVLSAGQPLEEAGAAMILIHGRGASAQDILGLGHELFHPAFAYLAPQAAGYTWYPYSFLAPIPQNEPGISSGISVITSLVKRVNDAGIPSQSIILGGFSQGACLATEYAARNPQRFGGVVGFSGGLIGPDDTPRDYPGSLAGTPIFLGCSDVDFHIPKERVELTANVLEKMGADVTMRLYPGMGHTINQDELSFARSMVKTLLPG
jgi:predicted esterase